MSLTEIRELIEVRTFLTLDIWLAVIGLIVSIIFYLWSKKEAVPTASIQLSYWLKTTNGPHEDLQVTFKGQPVDRVATSIVMFWNAGNHVLNGSDFGANNSLRIKVAEGVQVFGVKAVDKDPLDLEFSMTRSYIDKTDPDREIKIHFDFLRSGEGFKIQLCHDGVANDCVKLLGRYAGSGSLKIYTEGSKFWKTKGIEGLIDFGFVMVIALIGLMCFVVFGIFGKSFWQQVMGFTMLLFCLPLWINLSSRTGPKNL